MNGTSTQPVLKDKSEVIQAKLAAGFDPKEYFKDRKGLFVWSSFEDRILPKAELVKEASSMNIESYILAKNAYDKEIEATLPEKHIFSESEVCAIIADLIAKQPKGEEGALLSNGNWNIFYTEAFVVGVCWGAGSGVWGVYTWYRVGDWFAGERVFSPATDRS